MQFVFDHTTVTFSAFTVFVLILQIAVFAYFIITRNKQKKEEAALENELNQFSTGNTRQASPNE